MELIKFRKNLFLLLFTIAITTIGISVVSIVKIKNCEKNSKSVESNCKDIKETEH
tara:strand:+ start:285 stop:449 length:165 start_codon:yes stop_codon:yes gene_type:complete